jgi:hypothetical protein
MFQKDDTSSIEKSSPPTGAPKAEATPAAAPAEMKLRLQRLHVRMNSVCHSFMYFLIFCLRLVMHVHGYHAVAAVSTQTKLLQMNAFNLKYSQQQINNILKWLPYLSSVLRKRSKNGKLIFNVSDLN